VYWNGLNKKAGNQWNISRNYVTNLQSFPSERKQTTNWDKLYVLPVLKLTTIQILVLRPFSSHKCHIWRRYNIRNKLSFNQHSVSFISTRVLCFPLHNHVSIFVQTIVIIKLQALFRSKGIWVTKPCCRVPLITHHSMHCALMKKFASNQDVALRALCTLNKIL
jgi:hypothetical protein